MEGIETEAEAKAAEAGAGVGVGAAAGAKVLTEVGCRRGVECLALIGWRGGRDRRAAANCVPVKTCTC